MCALTTVALPHAALTGVDDTPSLHAPSSAAEATEQMSAKSRNADVGMSVSVEMNDGQTRSRVGNRRALALAVPRQ
jgi:D-serine deaminase-like pyridoxal phosphate-dependent protein